MVRGGGGAGGGAAVARRGGGGGLGAAYKGSPRFSDLERGSARRRRGGLLRESGDSTAGDAGKVAARLGLARLGSGRPRTYLYKINSAKEKS